jgi:hypothetical protein
MRISGSKGRIRLPSVRRSVQEKFLDPLHSMLILISQSLASSSMILDRLVLLDRAMLRAKVQEIRALYSHK